MTEVYAISINVLFQYSDIQFWISIRKFQSSTIITELGKNMYNNNKKNIYERN